MTYVSVSPFNCWYFKILMYFLGPLIPRWLGAAESPISELQWAYPYQMTWSRSYRIEVNIFPFELLTEFSQIYSMFLFIWEPYGKLKWLWDGHTMRKTGKWPKDNGGVPEYPREGKHREGRQTKDGKTICECRQTPYGHCHLSLQTQGRGIW